MISMPMEIKRKLISDKQTLKQRLVVKGKEVLYNDKVSIQQEDITLAKIYTPDIGAPKHTKQILTDLRGGIESNTIIGGFIIPLLSMDRSSTQNKYQRNVSLNWYIDQIN